MALGWSVATKVGGGNGTVLEGRGGCLPWPKTKILKPPQAVRCMVGQEIRVNELAQCIPTQKRNG